MDARSDLASIRAVLREALPDLEARFGVESLAVFGSIARGDAADGSDVDLLVRFRDEPPTLLEFVRLERQLADLLERPVDLVMETALKPPIRARILAECVAA